MKALYNPASGMVMEWKPLRAKMDHLQEVTVPAGTEYGLYDPTVVATVESEALEEVVVKPKKKAAPKKKKAAKKEGFPHAAEPYQGNGKVVDVDDI